MNKLTNEDITDMIENGYYGEISRLLDYILELRDGLGLARELADTCLELKDGTPMYSELCLERWNIYSKDKNFS